jgi:arylsulfatase A-like enzyme
MVAMSLALAIALHAQGEGFGPVQDARPPLPSRPDIVFILTDDQRWDELQHMPNVLALLQANGITFTNGFVSNPLCAPSRATILTGRYSGHNGVWSNQADDQGGWETFHNNGAESHTIATVLQGAGYYTGYFGKYINGYSRRNTAWVPPGWDMWAAFTVNRYYGPYMSIQGTEVAYPADQYSTDIIGQQAVDFIHGTPTGQPLFLFWAPKTPHKPETPLASDKGTLAGSLEPLRPPSYNEPDVRDKPWYVRRIKPWTLTQQAHWDQVRDDRYESLISVDRWVGRIIDALEQDSRLSNTLIVFTSDNGYLLGEHRLAVKAVPYEESIRVPWIVRWDAANFRERGRANRSLMLNTDFATTFAQVAGSSMGTTDGLDFAVLAADPATRWRSHFLIERGGTISDTFAGLTYCGVRSHTHTYVQYWDGFEELYDLTQDRNQLANIAPDRLSRIGSQSPGYSDGSSNATILDKYRRLARSLCNPVPPGFRWLD